MDRLAFTQTMKLCVMVRMQQLKRIHFVQSLCKILGLFTTINLEALSEREFKQITQKDGLNSLKYQQV